MARHKDMNWNLAEGTPYGKHETSHPPADVHSALLMDIRDELKQLNRILGCSKFIGLPNLVRAIEANTKKRKPQTKRKENA